MIYFYLLLTETVLCTLFFLICYFGTGSDSKNIRSFATYPKEVQDLIKNRPDFFGKMKTPSPVISFVSNVLTFSVLFFLIGLIFKQDSFLLNFLIVLFFGEFLNLFDFLIIDLCWWRNSKRVRFSGVADQKELYRSPRKHFFAFIRGVFAFLVVALIDGLILYLIKY